MKQIRQIGQRNMAPEGRGRCGEEATRPSLKVRDHGSGKSKREKLMERKNAQRAAKSIKARDPIVFTAEQRRVRKERSQEAGQRY